MNVRIVLDDGTIGFQEPSIPSARMGYGGFEGHVLWSHDCSNRDGNAYRAETILPYTGNGWTLVSADPLTVTPSVLCKACQTHGFITDGKWISV